MPFRKPRRNKEEWEILVYRKDQKIHYLTITHLKTGICLGCPPIVPDGMDHLDELEKTKNIIKNTGEYLLQELLKLDEQTKV